VSGFCLSVRSGEIVFQSFICDATTARVRPCALVSEFIPADGAEVSHAAILWTGAIIGLTGWAEAISHNLAVVTERVVYRERLVAL
jgi:hypothetical protein